MGTPGALLMRTVANSDRGANMSILCVPLFTRCTPASSLEPSPLVLKRYRTNDFLYTDSILRVGTIIPQGT